jgi:AcrR family transcriptional regulator
VPRPVNYEQREETANAIKTAARNLMAKHGTAGLSIRPIAREIGLTAPALYRYFENLDALITELIVDNFNALAAALEIARDQAQGQLSASQLMAIMLAYRQWALDHPIDFELIYGNPIPGYEAPSDITTPAAARAFVIVADLLEQIILSGEFHPPQGHDRVPTKIEPYLEGMIQQESYAFSTLAAYLTVVGWSQMHGIIMLELTEHITPIIGDMDSYYRIQMENLLRLMGISP